MKICGVYLIKNKFNGKKYVGSSCDVQSRWTQHFNGHGSVVLKRAIRKYGKECLVTEVLEVCERRDLPEAEAKWIKALKPEYNLDSLTDSGGRVVSATSKQRMSAAKLGQPSFMKGKNHSPESRAKMSAAKMGKPNGRLGIAHSPDAKAKISLAHTGMRHSPEHKEKIRLTSLGRKHSDEARAKIAASKMGISRPRPDVERKAISEGIRNLWANPEYRARQMAARARG